MSARRRKHSDEFRFEAVRLAREGNKSVAEIAEDLGIAPTQIYRWQRQLDAEERPTPSPGRPLSLDAENRRLREELRTVREERDILKKATAFFAKTSR